MQKVYLKRNLTVLKIYWLSEQFVGKFIDLRASNRGRNAAWLRLRFWSFIKSHLTTNR